MIVTRFNGTPAADTGAGAEHKVALAIRAMSPISYRSTFYRDGKAVAEGVNTLAADRRTFEEVSWRVGQPAKRVRLVYERR